MKFNEKDVALMAQSSPQYEGRLGHKAAFNKDSGLSFKYFTFRPDLFHLKVLTT